MTKQTSIKYSFFCLFLLFFITEKTSSSVSLGTVPFITTWKTDNPGTSNDNQITIPIQPLANIYNYTVDWGDGTTPTNHSDSATHTYTVSGTYTVSITGLFPRIYFNNKGDKNKILSIDQWGNNQWNSMSGAFWGCSNLEGSFSDSPDLSNVTTMTYMFYEAASFNHNIENWDVSTIENMSNMFNGAILFNQDIGGWNVSNVTYMSGMFSHAASFNQDIGGWDVSNVKDMYYMFNGATLFNQNIGAWNTSKVDDMFGMFANTMSFNQDIGDWDTSGLDYIGAMFNNATAFNQDISRWNFSNVRNLNSTFKGATSFNQDLNGWDVSNIGSMEYTFEDATAFNSSLDSWDVSHVKEMNGMFSGATNFNQDLNGWDVSGVTSMEDTFEDATAFNSSLGNWDVSNVRNMNNMFNGATNFNQDISTWDVSSVTELRGMFNNAISFNQNIENWNVSNVEEMNHMFIGATNFNQDISTWDVSSVFDMSHMFNGATSFNQDISTWDISNVDSADAMFSGVKLSVANYDALLIGWDAQNLHPDVNFDGGNSKYCAGVTARSNMVSSDNWSINDAGPASPNINDLVDQNTIGNYTLPAITGVDLVGNEAYYTGSNGTGTIYNEGEIINYSDFSSYPVTLYIYGGTNASCSSEQDFQLTITSAPLCTILSSPLAGATNVLIGADLTWNSVANVTGYKLTVGTSSGGNDILNTYDVGNVTNYDLPTDLPENSPIYVRITPYNLDGDAVSCMEEMFTTEILVSLPLCTTLSSPLAGATNVQIGTGLTWNSIANVTGYKLTVGTSAGGTDILNLFDAGNTTTYNLPSDLPENSTIYVSILPYNSAGDAISCTEEMFTTEILVSLPLCTTLSSPLAEATNVQIGTDLTWNSIANVTGYKIVIGDDVNLYGQFDVGNALTLNSSFDLPEDTKINVQIIPYNLDGDAIGCSTEFFTTETLISEPSCTILNAPINGDTSISVTTNLNWDSITDATGYKLTVGTSSGGTDILNLFDTGNTTTYNLPSDLPENSTIYVSILPYNSAGDAIGCTEESFTTETITISTENLPPKFFTPNNDNSNDHWIVSNSLNQVSSVFIFDRYGKLLKDIKNISAGWDGTYNGRLMPSNDYWYLIIYKNGNVLKGYFSLIR